MITKVRLPASLDGHALALRFVPIDSLAPAFLVVNCYLSSEGYVARGKHIGALMGIPVSLDSFFLGDWNFVLSEEDTPSRYVPPPGPFLLKWHAFIDRFSLKEISQPLHTWYRVAADPARSVSKRLDRIYVSHSETDLALNPPVVCYCSVPHSLLARETGPHDELSGGDVEGCDIMVRKSSSSDHIPVGISFGCPRGKGSPHIPRWMVEDALFGEIFLGLLAGSGLVAMASADPFRAHNEFVSCQG
jgi:hypothetical protein